MPRRHRLRPALLLLVPLALAACATPREQCLSRATGQLTVINRLIATTRANIERGYALQDVQEVRTVRARCEGQNEDGSAFTFPCEETRTTTRREPVAIDLNAEQAKLTSMLERQARLRREAEAAAQACIATYPE